MASPITIPPMIADKVKGIATIFVKIKATKKEAIAMTNADFHPYLYVNITNGTGRRKMVIMLKSGIKVLAKITINIAVSIAPSVNRLDLFILGDTSFITSKRSAIPSTIKYFLKSYDIMITRSINNLVWEMKKLI